MGVRTINRGNSRFYLRTEAPDIKYPGVTSVVGMLPKPFLQFWAAKMTAELAVGSLDFIARMASEDRAGAVDYLKGASRRYTKLRANIGSDAHDLFERMLRGKAPAHVHPDLEPYRRHFDQFLAAVNPELIRAEDVAWNDTYEYAGSFDAIIRVWLRDDGTADASHGPGSTPYTLIVDWKTSKSTYADVALQMSAYAHAELIIDSDGEVTPMPELDGAAVLHITPDDWEFKPVMIDDEVFSVFTALRRVFDWDRRISKTVFRKPLARKPQTLTTGTQRRA